MIEFAKTMNEILPWRFRAVVRRIILQRTDTLLHIHPI
jgi:hypothetical protein